MLDMGISSIQTRNGTTSNNHKLVIRVDDRDGLRSFLDKKGIETVLADLRDRGENI